jgi:hypothetical protein
MVISDTSSEYTELATVNGFITGPRNLAPDTALLTFDPSSYSAAFKNKRPLPASKLTGASPAINSNVYLYGNSSITNRPLEANAKFLGVATLHSVNQRYAVLGGKWPVEFIKETRGYSALNGCVARTSGMTPETAGGKVLFNQSLQIALPPGAAANGDYKDIADQLGPNVNTTNDNVLCLVNLPGLAKTNHSGLAVINYLMHGRDYYPG